MNPLVISLVATSFSILGAVLSAMSLARFASIEQRVGNIEGILMRRSDHVRKD